MYVKIAVCLTAFVLLAGCVDQGGNITDETPLEIHTYSLDDYFTITAIGAPYPTQRYLTTNCVFLPIENQIRSIYLEISWEAESPLVENLVLRSVGMVGSISKIGPSPITLEVENPNPQEKRTSIGFAIWIPDPSVAVQQLVSISMKVEFMGGEDFIIHYGVCS